MGTDGWGNDPEAFGQEQAGQIMCVSKAILTLTVNELVSWLHTLVWELGGCEIDRQTDAPCTHYQQVSGPSRPRDLQN